MMPQLQAKFGCIADALYRNALNLSSQKTYNSKFKLFMQFLQQHNIPLYQTDEGTIIAYVITRAAAKISHTTIKNDLFAIQTILFDLGIHITITSMHILEKVMHGIKRNQGPAAKAKPKLPITPTILQQLLVTLPRTNDPAIQVYRTAFTIATFAMLRCGEFTSNDTHAMLRIRHLTVITDAVSNSAQRIHLFLPASKTDVFRQGVTIPLPCICKKFTLCPVHEAIHLLQLYRQYKMPTQPDDPLFQLSPGHAVSRADITNTLNKLCIAANLPANAYSGHSFRKGGATSLAKQGAPDWMIQMLGRWKSASYKTYIKTPPESICQYIQTMLP